MKKKSIIIVAIILVLIGISLIFKRPSASSAYTVRKEELINTLQVNGTYTIAAQIAVMSPAGGIISELFVANGNTIKKGSPLFHIESTATEDQKRSALANYLAAKAALEADNAQLFSLQSTMYAAWKKFTDLATNSTYQNSDGSARNNQRVLPEFTTSQDDWLAAEANFKNQQSVIAKDQAAVNNTLLAYQETQSVTLTAPATGIVTNLQKKIGDQIQPAASATTPVLIIADFSNPSLAVNVSEVNISRVKAGQIAKITFDAFPDQIFTGTIESVDTVGTSIQGTISYAVRIILKDATPDVRPNMSASILIETQKKENILTVPNSAIITKNEKTYVGKEGGKQAEVQLGVKGLTKTEITGGLTEGEVITIPE